MADPTRRFNDLQQGTNYAYAKGLAVSPQHLALALDDMLAIGWRLVTILGDTSAVGIGFVFERVHRDVE
jgi:hypothetical protein